MKLQSDAGCRRNIGGAVRAGLRARSLLGGLRAEWYSYSALPASITHKCGQTLIHNKTDRKSNSFA